METTVAGICAVCRKEAYKVCSACSSSFYCSIEHQKEDWKVHKKNCKVYKVEKNDIYGRYMVATKSIPAGKIIMDFEALAIGPKQDTKPICLGCYKFVDESYLCKKCNLPLCGPICEKNLIHAQNECKVFAKKPIKITNFSISPIYECIFGLRCLLLKGTDPKRWEQLIQMEHHNAHRKQLADGQLWERNQVNVVNLLKGHFGLNFDENTIHTVLRYIDINSFEIKINGHDPMTGPSISGLYDQIYLLAHDCRSNTIHSMTDDFRMQVRTTVPIKKGDLITTTYAYSLEGTLERRKFIAEAKLFDCACTRCIDPTEFGTYFSAIKCTSCADGYLLPKDSIDPKSSWFCQKCPSSIEVQKVEKLVDEIKDIKIQAEGDLETMVQKYEEIIEKYSGKIIHQNHYLLIDIYHLLAEMYGRSKKWVINEMSLELLIRKEQLCRTLLKVLDILEPGLTRIRGVVLYELHGAIYFRRKTEYEEDRIPFDEFKIYLKEVYEILQNAHEILRYEAPSTPEGILCKSIPASISQLKDVLA